MAWTNYDEFLKKKKIDLRILKPNLFMLLDVTHNLVTERWSVETAILVMRKKCLCKLTEKIILAWIDLHKICQLLILNFLLVIFFLLAF
jgi:hypothetical protein